MSTSERWIAHLREHKLEQRAVQIAVDVAERVRVLTAVEMDRRLHSMNELRAQIEQERGMYLTRVEYEAKHEQLITRCGVIEARIQAMETAFAGLGGRLSIIAGLAGLSTGLITAIVLKATNI